MPTHARNGDPSPTASLVPEDPTKNVRDALAAAVERLDDLAHLRQQRADELRAAEIQRVNDRLAAEDKLRQAERERVNERMTDLLEVIRKQAEYYEKLRLAEAQRVDANRAEDQSNARLNAERLATQVTLLAGTQGTTAETLRSNVATTAAAAAQQLQQLLAPLVDKVAALEQQSYRGQGREAVADPALTAALSSLASAQKATADKLDALGSVQSIGAGRSSGSSATIAYIIAGVGLLGTIIAIGIAVLKP